MEARDTLFIFHAASVQSH
ncbi:hypothetical protein Goari_011866 [Gossypium aridum]|uniref:Uncharacterized protein n=1 Tax=Gossypium aridum TaxID=34290 RepID=A0A7J8WYQ8_GOSAI|nr:hypothetical protein [Gossypium aridum]